MKRTAGSMLRSAVAACALLALGSGTASADPDVVGKTYSEAKGMLGEEGLTAVVATMVGDRVEQDQCFVVSTSKVTSRDASGHANTNEVQVNLSCYGRPADGTSPGFSKGNRNSDALAVRDAHDEATKKWKATPEGQKWCTKFEGLHPEWAPVPDCPHTPEEEQAMLAEKDRLWKATPEGQKWCAKFEGEHPESAPVPNCHPAEGE